MALTERLRGSPTADQVADRHGVSLAPGKEGTAVKVFNRRIPSISQAFVYLEDGLAVVEASVG